MIEYQSEGEKYFSWWLDDLKDHGIIQQYGYETNTFRLSEPQKYPYLKRLVRKSKITQLHLLDEHVYTPDFLVKWNKEWNNIFYRTLDDNTCYTKPPFFAIIPAGSSDHYTLFEVKPQFDQNNMTRLFRITQKWLYHQRQIYVELAIVPETLFVKTFTPKRFLFTDKTKIPRKINFDVHLIEDYIAKLKSQQLKVNTL